MSIFLNSGLVSNNAVRNLNHSLLKMYKSAEKLSSGLRINSASDDPAGLVISEQMRSRIASLNQEIENVSNQINKYETASSATLEMRSILTEIRSLGVAASNGAIVDEAMQTVYQSEANRLVEQYNRIASTSQYGTQNLLDGSEGSLADIQELDNIDFSDPKAVADAVAYIDEQASGLDSVIVDLGATQKNDLESRLRNLEVESENLQAAESQIRDVDYVKEFTNFMLSQMQVKSGIAVLSHSLITQQTVLDLLRTDY